MTVPVSVGDDGRGANPPDNGEGPVLAAIRQWGDRLEAAMAASARAAVLQAEQDRLAATPVPVPLTQSGVMPASGTLYLDLGAPQLGRRWLVRLLTATGLTTAAVTGAAANFYVSAAVPPSGVTGVSAPASGWRWAISALPGASPFSNEQLPVLPEDHLYCAVSGAGAGTVIAVCAIVLDYPTAGRPRAITTT
jgi:hypothetical protein